MQSQINCKQQVTQVAELIFQVRDEQKVEKEKYQRNIQLAMSEVPISVVLHITINARRHTCIHLFFRNGVRTIEMAVEKKIVLIDS